jgi:signal transduction histidine kinase
VPVAPLRVLFVVLTPLGGVGAALYAFLWLTVPTGDPADAAAQARPPALARLASRPTQAASARRVQSGQVIVGLLLLGAAIALVVGRADRGVDLGWAVPALVLVAGLVLAWSQLDVAQRGLRSGEGGRRTSVLQLVGGVVLAGVGGLLVVGQVTGGGVDTQVLVRSLVAALAVLAGVGLVLAPWWLRLVRELGDERAARARESERADIAAHLHDSVLQTLALIRARADDPAEVARMARAQERELREWLYDDRPAPGTSVSAALRAVVAEVEDSRSAPGGQPVAIDTVVVGDRAPDAGTEALLQATREALVNAVVHGRPPVSLYLEVGGDSVEVFVRDHGDGFDLDAIGPDRFGVRESIVGRVQRRGGTATVPCRPGRGTEVRRVVPVAPEEPCPTTGEGASSSAATPTGAPSAGEPTTASPTGEPVHPAAHHGRV